MSETDESSSVSAVVDVDEEDSEHERSDYEGGKEEEVDEEEEELKDAAISIPSLPSEDILNKIRFFRNPPAAAQWTEDELRALAAAKKQMWSGVVWGALGGVLYGVSLAVSAMQVQSDFAPAPDNTTATPTSAATKSYDIGQLLVNLSYFGVGIGQAATNFGLGLYGIYVAYKAHSDRVKKEFGEAIEKKHAADEETGRYRELIKRLDTIVANQAKGSAGQTRIITSLAQLTSNVGAISTAVGTVKSKVDAVGTGTGAAIAALKDDLDAIQKAIDETFAALQSQLQHEASKTDVVAEKVQVALSSAQSIPADDGQLIKQAADLVKNNSAKSLYETRVFAAHRGA